MENRIFRLPDAELAVMQELWAAGRPLTRPELEQALTGQSWTRSTLLSLIARLEKRGFVEKQPNGKGFLYAPLVSQGDYRKAESRGVLQRVFGGSPKQFIAALYDGQALSAGDIAELEAYLRQLQKEE